VPCREADLAGVSGRRHGVVVEPEAAHEGQRREPIGLREHLTEQRGGVAAAGRHEHAHAGTEPAHRVGEGRLLEAPGHERG
jgi:hypothetical protein